MAHRSAVAPDAGERYPDDSLTAGRAHVPASGALEADRVLGNEHGPPPAWPRPNPGPVLREGRLCAGDAEGDGVPQRAPVAARLESKGVRARNAIAVIEVESHEVERAPVVLAHQRRRSEAGDFDRLVVAPLQRLLDTGRSHGRIRSEIPVVVLTEALLGFTAGALRSSSVGRDDLVAAISTVFLQGVLEPSKPGTIRPEHASSAAPRSRRRR